MIWFWMNVPFAALCFLAWTLIPLWIVIKRPDTGPAIPAPDKHAARRAAALAGSCGMTRTSVTGRAIRTDVDELSLGAIPDGPVLPQPSSGKQAVATVR